MLIGSKFSLLTVVSNEFTKSVGTSKYKRKFVDCICKCGNQTKVRLDKLKSGHTRSCGCLQKEQVSRSAKTHGLSKTRIYKIWLGMKSRCYRKNHINYDSYGGRGITVCNEWKNDPIAFINWSNKNGYSPDIELDRIDNDKGYSPNNCHWITHAENSRNQRLLRSTNTSGYRGVCFFKPTKKYTARVTYNYKDTHLGYFETAIEAALARDQYIIDNNLNLPLNNPL